MTMRSRTTLVETRDALKEVFRKWEISAEEWDWWRVDYDRKPNPRGKGMLIRYRHAGGQWQTVSAVDQPQVEQNARSLYLFLDRLRLAEQQGVQFSGLESKETGLMRLSPEEKRATTILDAYRILGVEPDATLEEIEAVFRAKSRFYHPDTNQGDSLLAERFKQINTALETIRESRKQVVK